MHGDGRQLPLAEMLAECLVARMVDCMIPRPMLLLLRSLQAASTAPRTLERAMHSGCMAMPEERLDRSGCGQQASWLQSLFTKMQKCKT